MHMKLSIIVPVYNVEQYLVSCLDSIIDSIIQEEVELIVINDGSTDSSLEIINVYKEKHPFIKTYNQTNKGLSVTRNAGLDYACGDYVWFVDSDDLVTETAISTILSQSKKQDVLVIGYTDFDTETMDTIGKYLPQSHTCEGKSASLHKVPIPAQFFVYRRAFLLEKNLKFYPSIYHEDFEFTPRMLYLASNVTFVNHICYLRRHRTGSITTTPNPQRAYDMLVVIKSLKDFLQGVTEQKNRLKFNNLISLGFNNMLKALSAVDNQEELNDFYKVVLAEDFTKALCASNVLKYKIEGICINLCPSCIDIFCRIQRTK